MNAIKRFGSAMIVPVLMFAFFGIVLGFATLFKNPAIMGSIAEDGTTWFKIQSYGNCVCSRFTYFTS
mgnify:CR=1 FL=1